jgi:hypothetical protein
VFQAGGSARSGAARPDVKPQTIYLMNAKTNNNNAGIDTLDKRDDRANGRPLAINPGKPAGRSVERSDWRRAREKQLAACRPISGAHATPNRAFIDSRTAMAPAGWVSLSSAVGGRAAISGSGAADQPIGHQDRRETGAALRVTPICAPTHTHEQGPLVAGWANYNGDSGRRPAPPDHLVSSVRLAGCRPAGLGSQAGRKAAAGDEDAAVARRAATGRPPAAHSTSKWATRASSSGPLRLAPRRSPPETIPARVAPAPNRQRRNRCRHLFMISDCVLWAAYFECATVGAAAAILAVLAGAGRPRS